MLSQISISSGYGTEKVYVNNLELDFRWKPKSGDLEKFKYKQTRSQRPDIPQNQQAKIEQEDNQSMTEKNSYAGDDDLMYIINKGIPRVPDFQFKELDTEVQIKD